jgi:CheY-like chemotaxis protein
MSDAVLLVTVADGGAGIPVEQQGTVFDALAGGHEATAEAGASVGVGVSVSAELVRGMGGRMWFESQVGEGTSFRFTVRLGLQDEGDSRPAWALWRGTRRRNGRREAPSPKPREHQVVLLAEDDMRDRSTLKQLLEDRGYAAITVEDGRGVLASMEHDSFDLVLMNLRMPGMDAFEAAAAIRALESGNGAQTPIAVLAADGTETDRQRCLAVGIDAWIAKPIRASEVLTAIEPLLSAAVRP